MRAAIRHLEPGRPAREGQFILERRHRIVNSLFYNSFEDARMLDVGCGNGAQTIKFSDDVKFLVGIDASHIAETELHTSGSKIEFVKGDALVLPFEDEVFDIVTSFEVLEHIKDDYKAVQEISRVLKPGAVFFFSVPNRWWIFETHGAVVPGLNWIPWNRVPFLGWLPGVIHRRISRARTYTLRRAINLINDCGLDTIAKGYITAPLDVLPAGWLREVLRRRLFKDDITGNPLLAVNLFVAAKKSA